MSLGGGYKKQQFRSKSGSLPADWSWSGSKSVSWSKSGGLIWPWSGPGSWSGSGTRS